MESVGIKHEVTESERNRLFYLSVESHYVDIADAVGKDDAILFEMGQRPTNEIDSCVTTNVEDARKFAESILKLCDEIEGGA